MTPKDLIRRIAAWLKSRTQPPQLEMGSRFSFRDRDFIITGFNVSWDYRAGATSLDLRAQDVASLEASRRQALDFYETLRKMESDSVTATRPAKEDPPDAK